MKYPVIDIGSNSMRLCIYNYENDSFEMLYKDKIMAGLAGYVDYGSLNDKGIDCAVNALLEFQSKLKVIGLDNPFIFATASLRNINNTEKVVDEIERRTGYIVDVISGEEEAQFDFDGAMRDCDYKDGILVDIGGASTEIVCFENRRSFGDYSLYIGSLKLYKECSKAILPEDLLEVRLRDRTREIIGTFPRMDDLKADSIIGVGGTARACLKLCREICNLKYGNRIISKADFYKLMDCLCRNDEEAKDLILKKVPDRVHTILPGMIILEEIFRVSGATEMYVSNSGAREGYLCRMLKE